MNSPSNQQRCTNLQNGRYCDKRENLRVKFGNAHIREFERIVGDHPSCSKGPPLGLGWSHRSNNTVSLDEYESLKESTKKQRNGCIQRLSNKQRNKILKENLIFYDPTIESKETNQVEENRIERKETKAEMDLHNRIYKEIKRLPQHEKRAYMEAVRLCPFLVMTETNPLPFVIFDEMDFSKAAKRLARHWTFRLELFGNRAFRSLYDLSGNGAFSERDVEEFNTGSFELLPSDVEGILILFANNPQKDSTYRKRNVEESMDENNKYHPRMRILFYLVKMAADSARSLVYLRYHKSTCMDGRCSQKNLHFCCNMLNTAFALKIHSVNFVLMETKNESKRVVISELRNRVPTEIGGKINYKISAISGPTVKDLSSVLKETFGVSKLFLPACVGGSWTYDNFATWNSALRKVQSEWRHRGYADENTVYTKMRKLHLSRWDNLSYTIDNELPRSTPNKSFSGDLRSILKQNNRVEELDDDDDCGYDNIGQSLVIPDNLVLLFGDYDYFPIHQQSNEFKNNDTTITTVTSRKFSPRGRNISNATPPLRSCRAKRAPKFPKRQQSRENAPNIDTVSSNVCSSCNVRNNNKINSARISLRRAPKSPKRQQSIELPPSDLNVVSSYSKNSIQTSKKRFSLEMSPRLPSRTHSFDRKQ